MALGTDHIITTEVGNFIPELWSNEVVASRKSNIVMTGLVLNMDQPGPGDTIRIPTPTRASASNKAAEAEVTLIQHGADAGILVNIDKHKEYSRFIEDIVEKQALSSLRRFYVDDAGFALAKESDSDLIIESLSVAGATIVFDAAANNVPFAGRTLVADQIREGDGSAWDEAPAPMDITDAGIRSFVKVLDDADAPMANRNMVIPTIVKQDLLGLDRFTEQSFTGEVSGANSIRNGLVGDVYGVQVYVTTRLPTVEDNTAAADSVLGLMFQSDAMVYVEQMGVRTQSQYIQQYLADLFTADIIYGTKLLREDHVVPFVVPTT